MTLLKLHEQWIKGIGDISPKTLQIALSYISNVVANAYLMHQASQSGNNAPLPFEIAHFVQRGT